MGAVLAFYTVFSVAPILIIAIGVVGMVIGTETVTTSGGGSAGGSGDRLPAATKSTDANRY